MFAIQLDHGVTRSVNLIHVHHLVTLNDSSENFCSFLFDQSSFMCIVNTLRIGFRQSTTNTRQLVVTQPRDLHTIFLDSYWQPLPNTWSSRRHNYGPMKPRLIQMNSKYPELISRSSRSGMQPKTKFLIPHLATNHPTTLTLTLHYRETENYGLSLKEMNQHNVSDMERRTTIVRIINGTVHTKVTSVSSWSANKTKLRSTPMKKSLPRA